MIELAYPVKPVPRFSPVPPEAVAANRLRLSLPDCVFVFLAIFIGLGRHQALLNADGDVARHLRVGTAILEGGLVRRDIFSHTRGGDPFMAYEWLSELLLASVHRLAGLPGVVVFSALLIASTYALVCVFLRRRGVDPLLSFCVAVGAAVLGSPHFSARPHLFTFLFTAALLYVLVPNRWRRAWLAAPFFAAWANLHPGFMFGLGVLAVMAVGVQLDRRIRGESERAAANYYALAFGFALVGSLVNPWTVLLHAHVVSHLGNSFLIANTQEFLSPDFHGTTGRVFLVALLIVILVLVHLRKVPAYSRLMVILACLALALTSQRNITLFGIVVLPLLALEARVAWRGLADRLVPHPCRVFEIAERAAIPGLWSVPATLLLVLLASGGGTAGKFQILPQQFDSRVFPVDLVQGARAAGLSGNLFNDFTWGGYLLYAWPEMPVFIDGATDFYGNRITAEYLQVVHQLPGWREVLERRDIRLILVPADSPISATLQREPGWRTWAADPVGVLFSRLPSEEPAPEPAASSVQGSNDVAAGA